MSSTTKIISVIVLVVVLIGVGIFMLTGWQQKKNIPAANVLRENINKNVPTDQKQPLDNQPRQVSGVVEAIDGETLSLRQDASEEINYEIKKSEVSSVSVWLSNETFDEQKYKEIMESMPELGEDVKTANDLTPAKVEEMAKKRNEVTQQIATDPALKAFSEESSDWSQIAKGSEIMVDVDAAGKKITILPAGFLDQMRGE